MSASVQKRTSRRLIPSARLHALAHCRGHVEAERLGCLQIDVALDFSGLLDWQVGRSFAIKNPANVISREAVCLPKVRSVAQQTSGYGEVAVRVDRWHRMAERQRGKLFTPAGKQRIWANQEPARSQLD